MLSPFSRTERLFGSDAMQRLARARVAVFGIGGVGGYVCEALCRSGVGALDLIDCDTVSITNLNRQIIALRDTVGRLKTDVMRERLLNINQELTVRVYPVLALPENMDDFPFAEYDYAVDAVDTVAAKVALAEICERTKTPLISSMGTGNKLDPSRLTVTDISRTRTDPLARAVRQALRKRGIVRLQVVWSDEEPLTPIALDDGEQPAPGRRAVPGSTAFVPPAAGLLIASRVVRDIAAGEIPADRIPQRVKQEAPCPGK